MSAAATAPAVPNVLAIAGSDPSGGAGVQADLKAFAALGVHGMAALTALTAQNTRGVTGVHLVPPAFVARQLDAVFDDVRVDAVKIGMVATAEIVAAIADALDRHRARTIVLDPVMIAKGGHALLAPDGVRALRERLVPRAQVITPNLPEAGALLGAPAPATLAEMREAARALHALGPRNVYLKGGHLAGDQCPDVVFDGERIVELTGRRLATRNTHGTGCTLSAAIAALLAHGAAPPEAMRAARDYVAGAIAAADRLAVGSGHGPVHHFHALWAAAGIPASDALTAGVA